MTPSRLLQGIAVTLHVGLVAGLVAWSSTLLGLALALVLVAPMPGLLRGRLYTYRWTCMLVTIYCAGLLADGYARPAEQAWSFALATVAALDFVAQVLFVRVRQREPAPA